MTQLSTRETHVSQLFFTRDRVYKLLKPITLSFLDFADRGDRIAATRRELELNRRIAPDVYLGLADLWEGGELADQMIIMRRMPDERRLSALVGAADFDDCLRNVARTVAAFHAAQPAVTDAPMATAAAVRSLWMGNFEVLERFIPAVMSRAAFTQARELALGYLDTHSGLFDQRVTSGAVRDGHGDLIADDIFCLSDGPRILDCLAFRDDFRIGDVLSDIGFLAMDLHRIAGAGAARALMRWYQEFSYEHHPPSLAHHYVAYRAHVRAKVACLTHEAGGVGQLDLATTYHNLALHHLDRARTALVLVGGAPGVGKSTIAQHLSNEFDACLLTSDEIRKDLSGIAHHEHAFEELEAGIYSADTTAEVYAEVLRQAALVLESGVSVILDASWASAEHREAARALAAASGTRVVEIHCTLDELSAAERIRERLAGSGTVSDVTPELAATLANRRSPWPEARLFATNGDLAQTLDRASELYELCLTADRRDL